MKQMLMLTILLTIGCGGATTHITTKPDTPKTKFTLEVARLGDHILLHYPIGMGEWREVCVKHEGRDDDKQNPGDYLPWSHISCWQPRFVTEQYSLRDGALTVEAVLWTVKDGVEKQWIIKKTRTRPEEGSNGIADEE